MDIELTDQQKMVQAMAREFAEKEVRPIAEAIDREARFPEETVRRMGGLGLMGSRCPRRSGAAAPTPWPMSSRWRSWPACARLTRSSCR